MKLTIGCTTRPFANVPFAEACQRIAAAGYTDVAVFTAVKAESTREEVLTARQAALGSGLKPSLMLAHARLELGIDGAVAEYRRLIDNAALLGASWLLDLGSDKAELYDRYVSVMQQAAPYAERLGLKISVKPHGGITLTADDLIALIKRVGHPAYGICYDPGNIIYYTMGARRPEMDLDKVAPLVTTGIIKDCIVRDGKPDVMITPGEGWVNFEAVFKGLLGGGFRGPLYLECVGGATLEEIDRNVLRTREYVYAILEKL
jgi:sugar phosphate isomerase/epimerase